MNLKSISAWLKQSVTLSLAVLLIAGFSISSVAVAQAPKAPPRTAGGDPAPSNTNADSAMPAQKAGPVSGSARTDAQMKPPAQETIDAFKKAYRAAGRPRFLVLVGIARDPVRDPGQGGGVGGIARGPGVGDDLDFTDRTGITELLSNGIGEILNDDGTLRQVDPSALAEKDRRDAATMAQNDADGAVDSMARKVNADLVLFIKFRPLPAAQRRGNDFSYSCISELKFINTATKMALTPFNWDGPLNNERARIYSSALSQLICERFSKMQKATGGLAQMSVQILGVPSAQAASDIRRGIKGLDTVEGTIDFSAENATEGGLKATYDFEFRGDSADLQDEMLKIAKTNNLELTLLDQKKNSIIYRAVGGGSAADPDWWLITDAKDNPVKDAFKAAYKKNPQSVALIINWLVEPQQMSWLEQLRHPLIRTQNDVRIDNKPLGPQTVALEQAESVIMEVLTGMGVNLVDPGQVGRIAQQQSDKAAKLQDDRNLGTILQNDTGYDLICMGVSNTGGKLDFKVINRRNAKYVGGVTWPASAIRLDQDSATRHKLERAMSNPNQIKGDAAISRYIAGNILLAIKQAIDNRATIAATVRNSKQATVQAFADALKQIPEITTDAVRMDNGLGSFNIQYTGAFQDLEERIRKEIEAKPDLKLIEFNPSFMALDAAAK